MKLATIVIVLLCFTRGLLSGAEGAGLSGEQALQKLKAGNMRYLTGRSSHPDQTRKRRTAVSSTQKPFALIVGCADSRVPPEIIFDQGLGDLFVIRVAGNIADSSVIGSIEYAVEHLGVQLVVVLGHERCGAVKATVDGGDAPGHIGTLVHAIQPAVEKVKGQGGDVVDNALRENARMVAGQLRGSKPILEEKVAAGTLLIVAQRDMTWIAGRWSSFNNAVGAYPG